MRLPFIATLSAALAAYATPLVASAHEVYVLTPTEIQAAIATPAFSEPAVAMNDLSSFLFWTFVAVFVTIVVFALSAIRPFESRLAPFFERTRRFAAPVARVTVGLSFLAAAYYQATYGPELPIAAAFGAYAPVVTTILVLTGILITLGVFVRAAAVAALALYCIAVWNHGIYMLTYTNYLGEILILLILGAHRDAPEAGVLARRFAPYSFALLRVCFGVSLFYASFYAKIVHNDLALQVASLPLAGHAQSLSQVFGLEPHFLVLGAAIIEIAIALFFILGIEIRFASLFLLFWLSLSLWWFGEVVWPHLILIGIPIAFIFWGYDRYSLEGRFMKKGPAEPVL